MGLQSCSLLSFCHTIYTSFTSAYFQPLMFPVSFPIFSGGDILPPSSFFRHYGLSYCKWREWRGTTYITLLPFSTQFLSKEKINALTIKKSAYRKIRNRVSQIEFFSEQLIFFYCVPLFTKDDGGFELKLLDAWGLGYGTVWFVPHKTQLWMLVGY